MKLHAEQKLPAYTYILKCHAKLTSAFKLNDDGYESAADSSDIQDTFDDEFKDTFENFPRRPPKRDHSPPNIFSQVTCIHFLKAFY
jgi:hypothetical protein